MMGVLFVLPFTTFSQGDTIVRQIQEVEPVSFRHVSVGEIVFIPLRIHSNGLTIKDIEELATVDAGELASRLPGVSMKSYGGLGGLKTVSMRAMGAQHNSIVIDGFPVQNVQTGQINLGQIQSDNLVTVQSETGTNKKLLAPVSALVSGSAVLFSTFESTPGTGPLSLRSTLRYGSFGQLNGYAGLKLRRKKLTYAAFGKFRTADGNYDYSYRNGLTWFDAVRKNNDYQDAYWGGNIIYSPNSNKIEMIRIGYKGSDIDQGLPGAVILYNETADERMTTQKHSAFADIKGTNKYLYYRAYAVANQQELRYVDPDFLNNSGGIDVSYLNKTGTVGASFLWTKLYKIQLNGGLEQRVSGLTATADQFATPLRYHSFALLGMNYELGRIKLRGDVSAQFIKEENRLAQSAEDRVRLNPFFSLKTRKLKKYKWEHNLWYRNSFRMPSFNELYFNNVGNLELLPEDAHQFNYGLSANPVSNNSRKDVYFAVNGFYNRVNNKIVAIPTKNLFVWSMQNVTNVDIYGAQMEAEIVHHLRALKFLWVGNYTWQKAIDVTEGSLNYRDQIAYVPEHMGNLDLSISRKKRRSEYGVRISGSYIGMRYALNENIESNEIEGYFLLDAGAYYGVRVWGNQHLRLQLNVKNCLNESYAYVRSFVMPGRNFLISLRYAFN